MPGTVPSAGTTSENKADPVPALRGPWPDSKARSFTVITLTLADHCPLAPALSTYRFNMAGRWDRLPDLPDLVNELMKMLDV